MEDIFIALFNTVSAEVERVVAKKKRSGQWWIGDSKEDVWEVDWDTAQASFMISLGTFAITATSESQLAHADFEEPVMEGGFEAVYHGTTSPPPFRVLEI
jgi:hypothetical protein